jgi:hypothetical protein
LFRIKEAYALMIKSAFTRKKKKERKREKEKRKKERKGHHHGDQSLKLAARPNPP